MASPARRRPDPVVATKIDEVFALVMSLPERRPAETLPRRLDGLFRELQQDRPNRPADDIEELIWATWIGHDDVSASTAMATAIEAMAADANDLAEPILDRLVEAHPDWAEAWNKRATLSFLAKRDKASLEDISRTLELEPRHFGAIAGFAQICLRRRRYVEARAVFQMALSVNPHLQGLHEVIGELGRVTGVMH